MNLLVYWYDGTPTVGAYVFPSEKDGFAVDTHIIRHTIPWHF